MPLLAILFQNYQVTFRFLASAHVKLDPANQANMQIAADIKEFFHAEGIHSTTIQLEFEKDEENPDADHSRCMILCSLDDACDEKMCCKPNR